MSRRLELRLDDIEQNIGHIRELMTGRDLQSLADDRFLRAAYERFVEIISEASRHIPEAFKQQHPHIPWRAIADTGNVLRHVYHSVDSKVLWAIHEKDLTPLHQAILAIRVALTQGSRQ